MCPIHRDETHGLQIRSIQFPSGKGNLKGILPATCRPVFSMLAARNSLKAELQLVRRTNQEHLSARIGLLSFLQGEWTPSGTGVPPVCSKPETHGRDARATDVARN